MKNGKSFFFLLKMALSVVLLYFVFRRTDLMAIFDTVFSISNSYLFVVVLLYFTAHFVNSVKWFQILRSANLKKLFAMTLITQYYSLILPGQLAGEAVKIYKLGKDSKEAEHVAASVVVDRITGLMAVLIVAISGCVMSDNHFAKSMITYFVFAILALTTLLYFIRLITVENAIRRFFNCLDSSFKGVNKILLQGIRFIEAWKYCLRKPAILLNSLLIGIIFQFICVLINLIFSNAFNIPIAFIDWCWIFGVISLLLVLPVTIGGIGLREGGFVFLIGSFGVSDEKALALSLSIFSLHIFGALVGGVLDFGMCLKK